MTEISTEQQIIKKIDAKMTQTERKKSNERIRLTVAQRVRAQAERQGLTEKQIAEPLTFLKRISKKYCAAKSAFPLTNCARCQFFWIVQRIISSAIPTILKKLIETPHPNAKKISV